jgi:hypothetical protein
MHALIIVATLLSSLIQHSPRVLVDSDSVTIRLTYDAERRLVEALHRVLGPADDMRWSNERVWRRDGTALCYRRGDTRTGPDVTLTIAPDCWDR